MFMSLLPLRVLRVEEPVLTREPLELLLEPLVLGRTLVPLLSVLVVPRLTCGVVVMLRLELELELLRLTCGATELRELLELELLELRLMLELLELRLTVGAVALSDRETAADWLLLAVLPPCERLRPWAIASDALKIRHPMRAKLIMIFVTEVFIIVMY
jgi:hypothetical protein